MFNTPKSIEKIEVMLLTDLDMNVMMDLLSSSGVYVSHVKDQASKTAALIESDSALTNDERHIQLEFLGDDVHYAQEAQELAEELAIIGLYKTIEIRATKAAKASKLFSNNKIKELYVLDKFIENFQSIGIDVTAAHNFNEFKELKLLNNCLKHSGEVSLQLADLNPTHWIVGQKINNFSSHFYRLLEPNIFFLKNLGTDLRSKI
jgi:hypothetical protein